MRIRAFLVLTLAASALSAQQTTSNNAQRYTKTSVMITMRDGVRLNTDIYAPKDRRVRCRWSSSARRRHEGRVRSTAHS
jgi:hypothetical protein